MDALDGMEGVITVRTHKEGGASVVIEVEDTGVGISPAIKDRLFDPFFTTKSMGKGIGIGLATCYGIIKDHDGEIDVRSVEGEGSCFMVTIPIQSDKIEMSKQAPHYVLVVDDEESIRRLLKNELSSGDRIVHTAENAQFARQALKKQQYDVIILDIRLPDADGLDLFAEFKMAAQDVEIILITGHGDIDNAVEAMRMGVL